jgi:hypothetical protein
MNAMNAYTNTIRETITSAIDAIRTAQKEAFAYANQQRATLFELLAEMRGTARVIRDVSDICEEAGVALLDIAEDNAHVAEVMNDSTYEFDLLPEGSYEGLAGFCDECGREIRIDEEYDTLGYGEYICGNCLTEREDEPVEEAEPVEEEQTEPNVAETEPTTLTDRNLVANEQDAQLTIDDILLNAVADLLDPTTPAPTTDDEHAEVEIALAPLPAFVEETTGETVEA